MHLLPPQPSQPNRKRRLLSRWLYFCWSSSQATALSEAFSEAPTPEHLEPWRLYITAESKWVPCVPGRDFQCNVSNCSRCALRTARRRQRGDKVWRLICRSHNKGCPIIFPIRKTQSKSECAAFPACHRHKPPASLVYISDFQLHQQRSWLFVPKTVPQVWDDILWEESPHHVSFSHAFIVRQGGKAFTTVLYRILGVSVWPSPCVITRFAGCEQASQQDAPVRLFTVTVRKQADANENRALTEERKKYTKPNQQTMWKHLSFVKDKRKDARSHASSCLRLLC